MSQLSGVKIPFLTHDSNSCFIINSVLHKLPDYLLTIDKLQFVKIKS